MVIYKVKWYVHTCCTMAWYHEYVYIHVTHGMHVVPMYVHNYMLHYGMVHVNVCHTTAEYQCQHLTLWHAYSTYLKSSMHITLQHIYYQCMSQLWHAYIVCSNACHTLASLHVTLWHGYIHITLWHGYMSYYCMAWSHYGMVTCHTVACYMHVMHTMALLHVTLWHGYIHITLWHAYMSYYGMVT